jgi:hypothetical protein
MKEKQLVLLKNALKKTNTLFCGQNLKLDIHLFVDGGSSALFDAVVRLHPCPVAIIHRVRAWYIR